MHQKIFHDYQIGVIGIIETQTIACENDEKEEKKSSRWGFQVLSKQTLMIRLVLHAKILLWA